MAEELGAEEEERLFLHKSSFMEAEDKHGGEGRDFVRIPFPPRPPPLPTSVVRAIPYREMCGRSGTWSL